MHYLNRGRASSSLAVTHLGKASGIKQGHCQLLAAYSPVTHRHNAAGQNETDVHYHRGHNMVHVKRLDYWCTGIISRSLGCSSGRLWAVSVSSELAYAGMGEADPLRSWEEGAGCCEKEMCRGHCHSQHVLRTLDSILPSA